jgi:hypothetical protein
MWAGPVRVLARLLVVFVALLAVPVSRAHAQSADLAGEWQQLTSSAGQCPPCRIAFAGQGQRLKVTANNGWSADVHITPASNPVRATGEGQWPLRIEGKSVSTPLYVGFALRGDHLHMTMVAELRPGRKQVVKAVFGRVWSGV